MAVYKVSETKNLPVSEVDPRAGVTLTTQLRRLSSVRHEDTKRLY